MPFCVTVLCFFFFFCALGCGQQEDVRPQFVRGNYTEHHRFFLGSEYEYLQTELEFDQPLYLNEPFLCAAAELSCPPLDCIPCDWSDPKVIIFLSFIFFHLQSPGKRRASH